MFSLPPFSDLQTSIQEQSAEQVSRAMKTAPLNISALAALLSPEADSFLPELASLSGRITAQRFGRTTQLYAPLYVSNYCVNRCRYCGFSADNKISRRLLSLDEAEQEALILRDRGFNHILLVSGEASSVMGVDYLASLALRLKREFAAVSIEVQPLSTEEYRRLFEAGITGVAVYQETYDRQIYDLVHISGQKADYDFRLEIPARAAAAGMREVGIGALLGLSDWRTEGLAIGMHLAWLRKKYWRTSVSVSFPRMRPATGSFEALQEVTERDLSQLIFALRIFDPDVGLVLSTREEARYRDGMLGLGPTRYSAGSCTAPGGYSKPDQQGEQFSIGDQRTLGEVCTAIREKGHDPVRKDWDMEFQK